MNALLLLVSLTTLLTLGRGQSPTAVEEGEQCSTCESRQQSKLMRLRSIKAQILSLLRLEQAPNISREAVRQLLPRAQPLLELLSQYEQKGGMAEDDEEQATTETIIAVATERKLVGFYARLLRIFLSSRAALIR